MLIRLLLIFCAVQRKTIRSLWTILHSGDNSSTRERGELFKDLRINFSYEELEKIVHGRTLETIRPITIWGWKIISIRERFKGFKKWGGYQKLQLPQVPLNIMICSWSSINLLSRMSMCSLSFSRLTRSGWSTQGSAKNVPACSGENSLPIRKSGFTNIADFSKNGGTLILLRIPFI